MIAQTISLTPGTLVLAARPSGKGTRLFVHILDVARQTEERDEVARVEGFAVAAFAPRPARDAA